MAGGVISVYGGLYGRPPFGFLAAPDIINGTGRFTKGIGNAGRPVSYTHLDVYKRQTLQTLPVITGASCIIA